MRSSIERPARNLFEALRTDAFGEPEPHQQIFVGAFLARQRLVDNEAVTERFNPHQPAFRSLLGRGGDSSAALDDAAMGARTDADIIVAAPIDQIVPAFGTGARVVGNLVGDKAGLVADFLCGVVEDARALVVRSHQLAACLQREERGVGFDGELIERQMLGGFADRAPEFLRPIAPVICPGRA